MSASQPYEEEREIDSSTTNLNSSSTQTTVVQSECPPSPLPQRDTESLLSSSHLSPNSTTTAPSAAPVLAPISTPPLPPSSPPPGDGMTRRRASEPGHVEREPGESKAREPGSHRPVFPQALPGPGPRTAEETTPVSPSNHLPSSRSLGGLNPSQTGSSGCHGDSLSPPATNVRQAGFVSSEQLQEILQELSVDAVMETALRSPTNQARGGSRRPSQPSFPHPSPLSPLSLRTPRSPKPAVLFRYPSISPYAMRKRRPPFHSPRGGGPPCFYPGSEPPSWRKRGDNHGAKHSSKTSPPQPEALTVDTTPLRPDNSDIEEEEEEAEEEVERRGAIARCGRCGSRPHRCSATPYSGHAGPSETEPGVEGGRGRRHPRDSYGFWDSDSSSSTDYWYYHRPYCDSCLQRASYPSSDSSSDSSDSEYEGGYASLYRSPHPVVFKEDLKPTFV